MHFVPTVLYILDLPLSSGANYKQIGETSLRTFSGLKILDFFTPGGSSLLSRADINLTGTRFQSSQHNITLDLFTAL